MKKNKSFYLLIIGILVGIFAFSGCTNHNNSDAKNIQQDTKDPTPEKFSVVESQEPTLTEVDWSNYFEGFSHSFRSQLEIRICHFNPHCLVSLLGSRKNRSTCSGKRI